MSLPQFATDFGDFFCVTAVAAVIFAWCWLSLDRLVAAAFGVGYAAACGVVTGLKLISFQLLAMPGDTPAWRLSKGAPSGHAALILFVYGGAAVLCARAARRWEGLIGRLACLAVIAGVLVTRVTLGAHTIADVIAGVVVGALVLTLPAFVLHKRPSARAPIRWLLAAMVVTDLVTLMSGLRVADNL